MAFDSQTRNKLQRMVGACRRLLADEFDDQLQGLYGIYAQDGRVLELEKLTSLDDDHHQTATLLRDRITHLTSGMAFEKQPLAEAVRRVLREQAFTLLNRFAALRMAEERGFVQECVGHGLKSKGFQLFETVAHSGLGGAYERYVTFIHGMFDELSLDLGVLFDRWSPFGLLFPREPALLKFFDLLNDPELKPLWREDETTGWIYQYFNDEAERKKMREESSAPRNSRELAVRNQFFTPRYVVEFLSDNTLGRIWHEMTQGETQLKEQCRYLVRRPNEIFLKPGENPPAANSPKAAKNSPSPPAAGGEGRGEVGRPSTLNPQLSTAPTQEELLQQPVHILHRPIKDPRTILMLDPACGSMHFGLYAFDLFEVIYDEAWELEERLGADAFTGPLGMKSLHATYAGKDGFLKDVPRLIIEHNLHGIDIDPRCAQIAGLSLWLRAQKAWQQLGLKPAERPAIKRSNIVCAEPMPGEKELLREFVEREFLVEERGVCLRLLEAIFDKMQLAGEAGSLLKIEEEIRSAIEDARRQWQTARQRPEFFDTSELARLDMRAGAQQELATAERPTLTADHRSLTHEAFWERIEDRVYAALRDYAEQAENGGGFQRRLFAEDAARGFAFIDVCRKRYDVALMNPPFGEGSKGAKDYISATFKRTKNDLYAVFVERFLSSLTESGALGAITSRSGFFLGSFDRWREELLLNEVQPLVVADLGEGVLDSAMVETAAYCLHRLTSTQSVFFRLISHTDKDAALKQGISTVLSGACQDQFVFRVNPASFRQVPAPLFAYWVPNSGLALFRQLPALENEERRVGLGLSTKNDVRFVRTHWEVRPECIGRGNRWSNYANGSNAVPFYWDHSTIVLSERGFAELRAYLLVKFPYLNGNASWILHEENDYQSPVIGWPLRSLRFSPQAIPPGFVFSARTYALISPDVEELKALLAFLSSKLVHYLLSLKLGASGRPEYVTATVRELPIPRLNAAQLTMLRSYSSALFKFHQAIAGADETSKVFVSCRLLPSALKLESQLNELHNQVEDAVFEIYGIGREQQATIVSQTETLRFNLGAAQDEEGGEEAIHEDGVSRFKNILIYLVGCAFGRWDMRYATGEQAAPELPDPFAPLPVCPPGQLQNAQGLPACPEDVPAAYPVRIPWDGILVDDPNHPLDIERRVRDVIEIIWTGSAGGPTAEAIEHEACEILGVKSLRDYFRKPAGFFAEHLKRYSKSRRQAPIYWPLATASGNYTLWIYYHRLTDQTLFQCVNDFVKPKLEEVSRDIERLRVELQRADGGSGKERERLEQLEDFAIELKELHDELLRVAGLPYKPNLNDGVLITASPLWKLFRLPKWQKDLKACWEALEGEEYEWAHLAYTIWPDRVKKVCKTDRSIAIAHGLEDLCDVKAPQKKAKRGKKTADAELALEGGNE